jgi:ABC-type polysaccharide/polyol phosphate export systems, permease component
MDKKKKDVQKRAVEKKREVEKKPEVEKRRKIAKNKAKSVGNQDGRKSKKSAAEQRKPANKKATGAQSKMKNPKAVAASKKMAAKAKKGSAKAAQMAKASANIKKGTNDSATTIIASKVSDRKEKFNQYKFVIKELTAREIKRKYSRSVLGIVWSVLNPLLSMTVISLVFSQIFERAIPNFPIYYLSGYLVWQMFTESTKAAMTTLVDNKPMLIKVKLPMQIFVLARVYTALVNLEYSLVAYCVMLFIFKVPFKLTMLFSPVIVIFLLLFSLGIAYILSTAYVFFGDVKHLYSVFLTLLMYCSAIFYPVDRLQGLILIIVKNNPIFNFIDALRKIVLLGELPTIWETFRLASLGIGVYALGYAIFKKNKNAIMQKI